MGEEKKRLPVGVENFEQIINDNYYYVDKTGFIMDLLDSCGSVNLFTRPRRFGKSLNMDMLKTFFEIGAESSLFDGLCISKETDICKHYMGKYPVISISLKDVDGMDFQTAYGMLGVIVSEEAGRLDFLLESDKLTLADKKKLNRLIEGDFEKAFYLYSSLKLLTQLLYKHYGIPVIVLLDEYDVPLNKAYWNGYYLEMATLIRSVFSQVLKTNKYLFFAVITGCLRIAKESIFTGLNNFKVRTISDIECAKYFGFTDHEVREMLCYYGVEERFGDVKEWYDGYRFGDVDVYCPWDVINQCDKMRVRKDSPMESHWENSSSNAIVRDIIEEATEATKAEIETLISGDYVEKPIVPELTYTDLDSEDPSLRQTYLWSVLLATGYLTDAGEPENGLHRLVIPNREVLGIYEKRIRSWFKLKIVGDTERWKHSWFRVRVTRDREHWQKFCMAMETGCAKEIENLFNKFMEDSISIRDTFTRKEMKENFFHGMLLGLLRAEGNWSVASNAESGTGYTDIRLEVPALKIGCIFEVKYAENGKYDQICYEAMKQIEANGYVEALKQNGMQTIHKYAIACYKKTCKISYKLDR